MKDYKTAAVFSHIDAQGDARMVDVSAKITTHRVASATGKIYLNAQALDQVIHNANKKGAVLTVAKIAGIQAAKRCAELIPLCHPLPLTAIDVECLPQVAQGYIEITAQCKTTGPTGVEMEALTACSIAALTLYDMCKAVDPHMRITDIQVNKKQGGKNNWEKNKNQETVL